MRDITTIKELNDAAASGAQDAKRGRYDPDAWGPEGSDRRNTYVAWWNAACRCPPQQPVDPRNAEPLRLHDM